jgi:toxin ParE1/3/4
MSAHRLPVVLTKRAQEDYRQILLYTLQTWGEQQQIAYSATLLQALQTLGNNPRIGRRRDDLRPGYHSYAVGQHIILYRITARRVSVSRIVHNRMDLRLVLGR